MGKQKKSTDYLRFAAGYNLAWLDRLIAEKDDALSSYYVGQDKFYMRAIDPSDPATFFIGPKGVGKSAVLQMVRLTNDGTRTSVINITPEDIAISPMANANFSTPLLTDPSKYRWLFRSVWDFVLSVEILHHEFPEEAGFTTAFMKFFRKEDEREARRLLSLSGRREGRKSIADRVFELVDAIEISAPTPLGPAEIKLGLRDKKITTPATPHSLLHLVNLVARKLPDLVGKQYYILIDDLDYQWANTPVQNAFVSSLFSSLAKLNATYNLKFVVALRRRIFRSLELEDKDKHRQWICDVEWDLPEIRNILQRRLGTIFSCGGKHVWGGVFPSDGFAKLYSATTGVPREAIRLSALCIKAARRAGHHSVSESDIGAAIVEFSQEKLEDIASDWSFQYPGLSALTSRMKGWHKHFSLERLREFAFDILNSFETNEQTVDPRCRWAAGYWEDPKGLAQILINCGILQLKEHQYATPEDVDFIERHEISDQAWLAFHPVIAPVLRAKGTEPRNS